MPWVVGDVQGCARTLDALLDRIGLSHGEELWLVGDLVNRGRHNVEVLRTAMSTGARVVLGNHDLHLLARAARLVPAKDRDTLDDVLRAPDREALLEWLRTRPFMHRQGGKLMIHGGLLPSWDLAYVDELNRRLVGWMGADPMGLLASFRAGREPAPERAQEARDLSVLVAVRTLDAQQTPVRHFVGPPEEAPAGLVPWYEAHPGLEGHTTYFGHWSALGHRRLGAFVSLDSGAVWGRHLTAVRTEDGQVVRQPTIDEDLP
ncbi:MAG: symmetrical bis(5'-nucleosyl)-tetraphosphatase [Myxococcota bacterium]